MVLSRNLSPADSEEDSEDDGTSLRSNRFRLIICCEGSTSPRGTKIDLKPAFNALPIDLAFALDVT